MLLTVCYFCEIFNVCKASILCACPSLLACWYSKLCSLVCSLVCWYKTQFENENTAVFCKLFLLLFIRGFNQCNIYGTMLNLSLYYADDTVFIVRSWRMLQ
jgi:hypothetical protein